MLLHNLIYQGYMKKWTWLEQYKVTFKTQQILFSVHVRVEVFILYNCMVLVCTGMQYTNQGSHSLL